MTSKSEVFTLSLVLRQFHSNQLKRLNLCGRTGQTELRQGKQDRKPFNYILPHSCEL